MTNWCKFVMRTKNVTLRYNYAHTCTYVQPYTYFALCLACVAGLLLPLEPTLPPVAPVVCCCCCVFPPPPPPTPSALSFDLLAIRWRSFLALFLPALILSSTSGCSQGGPWCSSDASIMHDVVSGLVSEVEEGEVEEAMEEGEGWRLASIS